MEQLDELDDCLNQHSEVTSSALIEPEHARRTQHLVKIVRIPNTSAFSCRWPTNGSKEPARGQGERDSVNLLLPRSGAREVARAGGISLRTKDNNNDSGPQQINDLTKGQRVTNSFLDPES